MEHIVQFAVGIDDDRITANVEKNAENMIVKELKQEVLNKLLQPLYRHGNATQDDPLSNFSEYIIKQMFAEHEEQIINKAADLLADRLARTKKGKAILEEWDK